MRILRILGIRGVPAAHGGFETFAEALSLHLVAMGWRVVVYCQEDGTGPRQVDHWNGVERVRIPVARTGPAGTIEFDWLATIDAARASKLDGGLCLTLGYNTAVFCALLRLQGVRNVINMDGIEWSRAKWGAVAKTWFWLNDWAGCWLGDHLVADHPGIAQHLQSRVRAEKITMIPYGADLVVDAPVSLVSQLGLVAGRYLTVIARPEPENSLLEIVTGFSTRPRDVELVVLGNYDEHHAYHRAVKAAAGPGVRFLGAIYDKRVVQALRCHCLAYVHGHQVGGTNPSLVEALGAGNAVIAHDNQFNRWVAGEGAKFFSTAEAFSQQLDSILGREGDLAAMRAASTKRYQEAFTQQVILAQYASLLERQSSLPV